MHFLSHSMAGTIIVQSVDNKYGFPYYGLYGLPFTIYVHLLLAFSDVIP